MKNKICILLSILSAVNFLHAQSIKGQLVHEGKKRAKDSIFKIYLYKEADLVDSLSCFYGKFLFKLKSTGTYTIKCNNVFDEEIATPVQVSTKTKVKVNIVIDELSSISMQKRLNALDSLHANDTIIIFALLNDMGEFSRFYEAMVITRQTDNIYLQVYKLKKEHGTKLKDRLLRVTSSNYISHLDSSIYETRKVILEENAVKLLRKLYNEITWPRDTSRNSYLFDTFHILNITRNKTTFHQGRYLFFKYLYLKKRVFNE